MLSDDMLRFVFVYDARFADALTLNDILDSQIFKIQNSRKSIKNFVIPNVKFTNSNKKKHIKLSKVLNFVASIIKSSLKSKSLKIK